MGDITVYRSWGPGRSEYMNVCTYIVLTMYIRGSQFSQIGISSMHCHFPCLIVSRLYRISVCRSQNVLKLHFQTGLGKHSFQKNATFLPSFVFLSKERNILAFFCVLYKKCCILCVLLHSNKRTLRSLHSFTFFIKERGVLWVLLHSFAFFLCS